MYANQIALTVTYLLSTCVVFYGKFTNAKNCSLDVFTLATLLSNV